MLKQFILGGVALAIVGGVALAENNDASSIPAQNNAQVTENEANPPAPPAPQQGDGQGWWGRHMHHHGWGRGGQDGPGRMGMGGPMGGPGMGMMMDRQGFRLSLGKGINVGVMCGKEAIKDCIAEAQPLIDAAKAAATAQASATKSP